MKRRTSPDRDGRAMTAGEAHDEQTLEGQASVRVLKDEGSIAFLEWSGQSFLSLFAALP
ncbi:hypothetical protein J4G37_16655 [Microvirga sp. 3-52]|nr:hypothetical protein [Microvirga sp. 3-52]